MTINTIKAPALKLKRSPRPISEKFLWDSANTDLDNKNDSDTHLFSLLSNLQLLNRIATKQASPALAVFRLTKLPDSI